jgi:hypothetical protein
MRRPATGDRHPGAGRGAVGGGHPLRAVARVMPERGRAGPSPTSSDTRQRSPAEESVPRRGDRRYPDPAATPRPTRSADLGSGFVGGYPDEGGDSARACSGAVSSMCRHPLARRADRPRATSCRDPRRGRTIAHGGPDPPRRSRRPRRSARQGGRAPGTWPASRPATSGPTPRSVGVRRMQYRRRGPSRRSAGWPRKPADPRRGDRVGGAIPAGAGCPRRARGLAHESTGRAGRCAVLRLPEPRERWAGAAVMRRRCCGAPSRTEKAGHPAKNPNGSSRPSYGRAPCTDQHVHATTSSSDRAPARRGHRPAGSPAWITFRLSAITHLQVRPDFRR